MSGLIDFSWDLHVHSSEYSDDATSTMLENVAAAVQKGVKVLGLADHVRKDSLWIAGRNAKLAAQIGVVDGVEILSGVEAKIWNVAGDLDLPGDLTGIDYILIADHRYPGVCGPVDIGVIAALLRDGKLSEKGVIEEVISAMVAAVVGAPRLVKPNVLAHPFSLLPKIGVDERAIEEVDLERLAGALLGGGTLLELNEKWGCPGVRVLSFMSAAGVGIVGGSDAHSAGDVGGFERSKLLLVS